VPFGSCPVIFRSLTSVSLTVVSEYKPDLERTIAERAEKEAKRKAKNEAKSMGKLMKDLSIGGQTQSANR
jgi:hypothetical protein